MIVTALSGPRSILFNLFLAFWIIYLIRMGLDTLVSPAPLGQPAYMYWTMALGGCFLPALALSLHGRGIEWDGFSRWLIASGVIVLVLAMVAGRTTVTGASGSYDTGRLAFDSLNSINLGHAAATVLLAVYWRLRFQKPRGFEISLNLVIGAISLWGLLASGSRGPLVACILGLLFLEVVKGGRALIVATFVGSPLLALLAIDPAELDRRFNSTLFSRLESGMFAEDAASSARLVHLDSAWQLFLEKPVFGAALEDPRYLIWPHNIIVEAFMAIGIIGGLLMIALCIGALTKAFRWARSAPASALPGALLVQYLTASQFSGAVWGATSFWTLLGLLVAAKVAVPSVAGARRSPAGLRFNQPVSPQAHGRQRPVGQLREWS
jgi:hypothetical protein